MTELIPLREAARRLGLSPKTIRNHAARVRAGLPVGWNLPLVRIGSRLFIHADDIDRFINQAVHADTENPRGTIDRIATDIEKVFPEHAERLRSLVAVIPNSTGRSRKPARGAGLLAVEKIGNTGAGRRTP